MGYEIARAYIRTRVDNTELPSGFEEMRSQAESALSDIRAYIVAFLAPIAMMGESWLQAGTAAASFAEDTYVAFKRMLGSAEDTQKVLDDLTQFAAETPFEMPQLLQVTRGLIEFGERGEDIMKTLKMLGDASGGTAQNFQLLGFVFNQIRGVGRLMRQDFYQLSSRGIISLKDISNYYGITEQAANEMLSSGKITFEEFRKILEKTTQAGGKNFNAMIEASKTLSGRISTLNDAVNILGRSVSEALVPWEKFKTDIKIAFVETLQAAIDASGGFAAAATVGAIRAAQLGTAIFGVGLAARFLGVSIRAALIGSGIGVVILAIGAAVGMLVKYLSESEPIIKAVADAANRLAPAWGAVTDAAWELAEAFGELFEAVWGGTLNEALDSGAQSVASWISWFADEMVEAAQWVEWLAGEAAYWIRNGFELGKVALLDFSMTWQKMLFGNQGQANEWAAAFIGVLAGLEGFFSAFADNIVTLFTNSIAGSIALLDALWAAGEALLTGDNPIDAYNRSLEESIKNADPTEPFKDQLKAFTDARDKAIQDVMDGLEDKGLWDQMEEERQRLLELIAQREKSRAMRPDENGEFQPEGGKDEEDKDKGPGDFQLEAGRYGFRQFGTAIQDAILNRDKDNLGKIVTLTQSSVQIQQKILEENKKTKGGLTP